VKRGKKGIRGLRDDGKDLDACEEKKKKEKRKKGKARRKMEGKGPWV
jgi:hypothetical protein